MSAAAQHVPMRAPKNLFEFKNRVTKLYHKFNYTNHCLQLHLYVCKYN